MSSRSAAASMPAHSNAKSQAPPGKETPQDPCAKLSAGAISARYSILPQIKSAKANPQKRVERRGVLCSTRRFIRAPGARARIITMTTTSIPSAIPKITIKVVIKAPISSRPGLAKTRVFASSGTPPWELWLCSHKSSQALHCSEAHPASHMALKAPPNKVRKTNAPRGSATKSPRASRRSRPEVFFGRAGTSKAIPPSLWPVQTPSAALPRSKILRPPPATAQPSKNDAPQAPGPRSPPTRPAPTDAHLA